jgi:DNA-binding transcriptional MerR regulator
MKIGELASATATKVETVRYYEKIGLLRHPRAPSANYRAYGSEHLARLSFIRRARDLGFTLEAVRELLTLSDDKAQSCEAVDGIARTHLDEIDRKSGRPDCAANRTRPRDRFLPPRHSRRLQDHRNAGAALCRKAVPRQCTAVQGHEGRLLCDGWLCLARRAWRIAACHRSASQCSFFL